MQERRPRHPDWQYMTPEQQAEASMVRGGDGWYSHQGMVRDGVFESLQSDKPHVRQQAREVFTERVSRNGND